MQRKRGLDDQHVIDSQPAAAGALLNSGTGIASSAMHPTATSSPPARIDIRTPRCVPPPACCARQTRTGAVACAPRSAASPDRRAPSRGCYLVSGSGTPAGWGWGWDSRPSGTHPSPWPPLPLRPGGTPRTPWHRCARMTAPGRLGSVTRAPSGRRWRRARPPPAAPAPLESPATPLCRTCPF